jgi:hypothetical protein
MTSDFDPKSAFELAMARLKKKDAEEGVEHRPLTDAQKATIADVRSQYKAKLADLEIRHQPVTRAAQSTRRRRRARTHRRAASARRGATEDRDPRGELTPIGAGRWALDAGRWALCAGNLL